MHQTKCKIALLFFCLCSINTFAQENYLPGYILHNNGDTARGYVDNREWVVNPKKVSYKPNLDAEEQVYQVLEIHSFAVENEIYVSGIVETEISNLNASRLTYEKKAILRTDTVFLQTLVKGEKGLYYYYSKSRRPSFYSGNDHEFNLLLFKRYLSKVKEKTNYNYRIVAVSNNAYAGQIYLYLQDCPEILEKAKNLKYKVSHLIKIYEHYYKCMGKTPEFVKKKARAKLSYGLTVGISSARINFESEAVGYKYLVNANYQNSVDFTGGLVFEIAFPRKQYKWSSYNELVYSSYNLENSTTVVHSENLKETFTSSFDLSYVKLNSLIRYSHPMENNLGFFINSGLSFGYLVSGTPHYRSKIEFFDNVNEREISNLNEPRKVEMGIVFGAGLKYSNVCFEIRHERANGFLYDGPLTGYILKNSLLCTIKF